MELRNNDPKKKGFPLCRKQTSKISEQPKQKKGIYDGEITRLHLAHSRPLSGASRHHTRPTTRRHIVATATSALLLLVKHQL